MSQVCTLLGVTLFSLSLSNGNAVTLEDVLSSQLKYFNSIQSIDYQFKESLNVPNVPEDQSSQMGRRAYSHDEVRRVRVKGPMWRGDIGIDPESTNGGYNETHAYNGNLFQRVDNGNLYFSRVSKRVPVPMGFVSPTLRPFSYFFNTTEYEGYSALKEEATWRSSFETCQAVLRGEQETVLDHECVVLEMKPPAERAAVEDDVRYYVYLAKDADFFPVRIEVKSLARNHCVNIMEVKSLEQVKTETGETVWFPTLVENRFWGRIQDNSTDPRVTLWEIDKSTVRINGAMDDEVFRIDALSVKSVTDQDFLDIPANARDVVAAPSENAGAEASVAATEAVGNAAAGAGVEEPSKTVPVDSSRARVVQILLVVAALALVGLAAAVLMKGPRPKPPISPVR